MRALSKSLVIACTILETIHAHALAQSVQVEMSVDRNEVNVGETFQLEVHAQGSGTDIDDVRIPNLNAFQIVGRQVSRPMQVSFGFGSGPVIQASIVYSFALLAAVPGRYTIEAPKASAHGKWYSGNRVTINVQGTAAAANPSLPPEPDLSAPSGTPSNASSAGQDRVNVDPEAFLRTVVDKSEPYVGEQVTVTMYLYTRNPLQSSPAITKEPTADGFWVHDLLPPSRNVQESRQVVNGMPFHVYVLRRFAAFPLKAGTLTISPMSLSIENHSIFDLFDTNSRSLQRTGLPAALEVRALPSPPPHSGDIHVGEFTLETRVDRSQVPTGDAITFSATVRGSGNIRNVKLTLPSIQGLQILPPQMHDALEAPGDRVSGTRTIEWLIVPEHAGDYTIPSLEFLAFNPSSRKFSHIASTPISIKAAGNALPSSEEKTPTPKEQESAKDASEFGPIHTLSSLQRRSTPLWNTSWYRWAFALGPLLFVVAIAWVITQRTLAARSSSSRALARNTHKRLIQALEGDPKIFYAEIASTLQDALESRLDTPIGGFTRVQLSARLREAGLPKETAHQILQEFEKADSARFGMVHETSEERKSTLERTLRLIRDVESSAVQTGAAHS